ncbi:MAG: preprotein translocase subunit SecG [Hydrogenophilales bacterium 28-61-23]|nr:MAG: preprotein translocase subunit SecG [Hydrogenophilales bacterium 28-61-23]
MEFLVWIVHILVAAAVVILVLLQHGKGADMGAAFGSGSSGSLFGASGSANFMSRATAVMATLFFLTSLGLTYFSSQKHSAVVAPVTKQTSAPQPVPVAPRKDFDLSGAIPK